MFSPSTELKYPGSPNSPGTEPMNLGSPVSSPSSLNNSLSFLPNYLLRDGMASNSPNFSQSGTWNSPIKSLNHNSQMSPVLPKKTLYRSPSSSAIGSQNITKTGGPPVQGLFDSLVSPKSSQGVDFSKGESITETSVLSYNESVLSPAQNFTHNNSSFMSPAQIDPFFTQGEALKSGNQLDETWITVFGFPPASVSFILQQFSQYGKIVDHKLAASGNWMHIRYQSKLQAKKALSKSGKIYGDNIMVGVKPCIDMSIMSDFGKENTGSSFNANLSQGINTEILDSNKRSLKNIRPLTQMYQTPTSDTEVTPKNKIEPKANSLVSRAMGYVLNW